MMIIILWGTLQLLSTLNLYVQAKVTKIQAGLHLLSTLFIASLKLVLLFHRRFLIKVEFHHSAKCFNSRLSLINTIRSWLPNSFPKTQLQNHSPLPPTSEMGSEERAQLTGALKETTTVCKAYFNLTVCVVASALLSIPFGFDKTGLGGSVQFLS